jgi:hypothetical protein
MESEFGESPKIMSMSGGDTGEEICPDLMTSDENILLGYEDSGH